MFQFLSRRNNNPNIRTSAMPDEMYDAVHLQMHQRALRGTMYGLGDIIRAVVDEGRVKFQYMRNPGVLLDTPQEAFNAAAKDGVTTFSRLTGTLEDSSLNLRGLAGIEQRLISIQDFISKNPAVGAKFGITDPSEIHFEIGTFKTNLGDVGTIDSIKKRVQNKSGELTGLIIPDDNEFNLLQIHVGRPGQSRALTLKEMSSLFLYTSDGRGGIFGTEELIEKLKGNNLNSIFSKFGKRGRGAIGLRDLSITGSAMADILSEAGIEGTKLDDKNVLILKVADDLEEVTKQALKLMQITGETDLSKIVNKKTAFNTMEFLFETLGEEQKAFYSGNTGVLDLISEALKVAGVTEESQLIGGKRKTVRQAFESAFDGAALLNTKLARSTKKYLESLLEELLPLEGQSNQIDIKIMEIRSQLENLKDGNFETVTTRTFFDHEGKPVTVKAVLNEATFKGPLQKFALIASEAAIKREAGFMAGTSAMNLVLQGEPSGRVYYDPLAPAFHYNIFSSPEVIAGQEKRQARLVASLKKAFETGEIDPIIRRQINRSAEFSIESLPAGQRASAERTRLYMRKLQQAIQSGIDVRTMPELFNYLLKTVQADLYRQKDGIFQPALEDAFRYAINSEQDLISGTDDHIGAMLGKGYRNIFMKGMPQVAAMEFNIRGHQMMTGGNAAQIFKHALGGFDYDDHGLVLPRVFIDNSDNQRLASFIFRQPTGPAEFIFSTPQFSTTDSIKMIFANNDALMNVLDNLKPSEKDEYYDLIRQSIDVKSKSEKAKRLDQRLAEISRSEKQTIESQAGAIESRILNLMNIANEKGIYSLKTIRSSDPVMQMLAEATKQSGEPLAAPLQLDKKTVQKLLEAGTDVFDEQFLVRQYSYGEMQRLYKREADALKFDEETQVALRKALGGSKDFTLNEIAEKIEVARQASDNSTAIELQSIIEPYYGKKAIESLGKKENIGQYINKLLIASASGDQEAKIIQALKDKRKKRSSSQYL